MTGHRREIKSRSPIIEMTLAGIAIPALLVLGYVELKATDPPAAAAARDASSPAALPTQITNDLEAPVEPAVPVVPAKPLRTIDAEPSRALTKALAAQRQRELRAKVKKAAATEAASATTTTTGLLGEVSAPLGKPVTGDVTVSVANIPNTQADARWSSSVGALIAPQPDFVTLNEVYKHSNEGIEAVAPGYTVHRAAGPENTPGAAGQSMNNALLYRSDTWTQVAGGMVKVVDDDIGFLRGKSFLWDRFAVWSILQRADGAIVSLISTHMPTNPGRYPAQPGNPGMTRATRYSLGMDKLISMTDQLSTYGPVLIAGDMNSHPDQGPWGAAAKFGAAGYQYVKDTGVMYLFFSPAASVVSTRQISIYSDHPALISTLDMNGLGPS